MKHKKYDFRTAYIDLLLNVLTAVILLFMVTTILIQSPVKPASEGIKKNAEAIASIKWDGKTDCDADLWVRDPQGNVVSFQHKDDTIMHLERDDLGLTNDVITDLTKAPANSHKQPNEENWVLRGQLSGEYVMNIHVYGCRIDGLKILVGEPIDLPVDFELIKINPKYEVVYRTRLVMKSVWEEQTIVRFTMDNDGNISKFNNNFENLIKEK